MFFEDAEPENDFTFAELAVVFWSRQLCVSSILTGCTIFLVLCHN